MKTYTIIFSPTGGTEKAANAITSNWTDAETIDLSDNKKNYNISLEEGSLALIAMPSFGGLAPQLALDRLSKIKANGSKCAIVAVYGNRAYDDTLIQMKDYSEKAGASMVPKASSSCTSCGACAKVCPAGAIDTSNPRKVDKSKCIGCMRCISVCPAGTRKVNPVMTTVAGIALKKACSKPKTNEMFI